MAPQPSSSGAAAGVAAPRPGGVAEDAERVGSVKRLARRPSRRTDLLPPELQDRPGP